MRDMTVKHHGGRAVCSSWAEKAPCGLEEKECASFWHVVGESHNSREMGMKVSPDPRRNTQAITTGDYHSSALRASVPHL